MWDRYCFAVRDEIALAVARLFHHLDLFRWCFIADINFVRMIVLGFLFFIFISTAAGYETAFATLLTA